jgi:polyisoprenoid-binding protein YceI
MTSLRHWLTAITVSTAVTAPALSAPETFVVDPTHTYPRFSYDHFGLSTQLSKFTKTSGKVILDKAAETASVEIDIDMKSVDTGYATFNEHIQAEDFLDTNKFPKATFKSTKVIFDGDKPASIEGNLTIKGITKPVTLKVNRYVNKPHPMRKVDVIGADASTVIKRSDFNAGKFAPAVGDEVTITVAIEALKQ